jgi:hypothetical protein
VIEVIDANSAGARDELVEWVRRERSPGPDSSVAMGMMFAPMPLPGDKQPYVKDVEGVDDRLTILWFTEGDSLDAWDDFAGVGDLVEATGLGRVELMAPFTPTLPGTDRYVDELRASE